MSGNDGLCVLDALVHFLRGSFDFIKSDWRAADWMHLRSNLTEGRMVGPSSVPHTDG